jgi:hypothetical protein
MADQTQLTVFCTKYALSSGIFSLSGSVTPDGYFIAYRGRDRYFLGKREWHLTKADALADFERRRAGKIASMRKQLERLESLKPSISEGI